MNSIEQLATELQIVKWPNPILSAVSRETDSNSEEIKTLAQAMLIKMKKTNGIGLAAPQIGQNIRLFVVHIPFHLDSEDDDEDDIDNSQDENSTNLSNNENIEEDDEYEDHSELEYDDEIEEEQWWHNKDFVFINPKLTKLGKKIISREGCLSLPGLSEEIKRYEKVKIQATDLNGELFEIEANGLFAICLQHENDHLDGKVYIQHLSRLKYEVVRKKYIRDQQKKEEQENDE